MSENQKKLDTKLSCIKMCGNKKIMKKQQKNSSNIRDKNLLSIYFFSEGGPEK